MRLLFYTGMVLVAAQLASAVNLAGDHVQENFAQTVAEPEACAEPKAETDTEAESVTNADADADAEHNPMPIVYTFNPDPYVEAPYFAKRSVDNAAAAYHVKQKTAQYAKDMHRNDREKLDCQTYNRGQNDMMTRR